MELTRDSRLERALFACDEMAGFVTAALLIRPSRAVSRDDRRAGAALLGLPLEQHANVIGFMRDRADALGLRGNLQVAVPV